MIPRLACQKCGATIEPTDKFCSSCGERVEWPEQISKTPHTQKDTFSATTRLVHSHQPCPLCGQMNDVTSRFCESCGAALSASKQSSTYPQRGTETITPRSEKTPLRFFQSWKLTAGLGVIFIVLIIVFSRNGKTSNANPHASAGFSMEEQKTIEEIGELQRQVDANPTDSTALLKLANILHDKGLFDRAIVMYERYLDISPKNPDARIDLGTSYFKLSFKDSLHHSEDLQAAKREMTKAISFAPSHQLGYFNLGIVNFHAGSVDEARACFQKCVAIDPHSESGKKAQEFLNQQLPNNNAQ